jgi:hypothetical protein
MKRKVVFPIKVLIFYTVVSAFCIIYSYYAASHGGGIAIFLTILIYPGIVVGSWLDSISWLILYGVPAVTYAGIAFLIGLAIDKKRGIKSPAG